MVHIAVDIGASSGRLVVGELREDKLEINEIHRFENRFSEKEGMLYWDIDYLLHEILTGLQIIKQSGVESCTVGIDTWAVDYILLNEEGVRLKDVVSYRDNRTLGTIDKVSRIISPSDIYAATGIQFLPFNTLFQLYEEDKEALKNTNKIVMVPDYINYRLTGNAFMETTNASTTQLVNVHHRQFDSRLLQLIGLKSEQFADLLEPGCTLGPLRKEWFPNFNLPDCQFIVVASHDTASAVVGTPGSGDDWAYLSSGTWSLLGIETNNPIINSETFKENYTNEWGVFNTYRFLKNIMGMWVIEQVRKQLKQNYTYEQLVEEAKKAEQFQQYINLNDDRFLNPKNMIEEIQAYCQETEQPIPHSAGELAACVYNNLAIIYSIAIADLERITKKNLQQLYIVGGGAKNEFLNQLTANISTKTVFAGPTEATAIGNIVMQLITANKVTNLEQGRELIRNSFTIKEYTPAEFGHERILEQFKNITMKEGVL